MNNDYQRALDTKLEWLHWSFTSQARESIRELPIEAVWPMYQYILHDSDTYFMNDKFCDLVDVARRSVPDDLEWQAEWVPTKRGFMWLEKPFAVPHLGSWAASTAELREGLSISAVGWFPIAPGRVQTLTFGKTEDRVTVENEIQVCFFLDFARFGLRRGFNPWAYCSYRPGDRVIDRIKTFEKGAYIQEEGAYAGGRETEVLHEIRWLYSAFHLMSQRLALRREHQANRHLRRRLAEAGTQNTPAIQYVTLRRYEEAREKSERTGEPIEWSHQWIVNGHWRNQWYATEQKHRPVWINDYIKGPEDKPLKPPTEKIYRAVR